MTIDRHAGQMQIACNTCGHAQQLTYARDDFDVMIADAKVEGFVSERIEGEWTHTCADCADSARRAGRSFARSGTPSRRSGSARSRAGSRTRKAGRLL